jgi:phage-related protein
MAENQIPFEATLNDGGLTLGIDDIAQALRGLDEISAGLGEIMSASLTRAEEAIQALAGSADLAAGSLRPLAELLGQDAGEADASAGALGGLAGEMENVASATGMVDASLVDVVSALVDLRGVTESVAGGMDALIVEAERSAEALNLMAEEGTRGGEGLGTLGNRAKEAGESSNFLADSIGGFIATMAGFTVINDAWRGLEEFGNSAIYGNMMIERLQATLAALTGSKGAAQQIVDWSYAFGRSIPDTTTHLQQAIVTIASLGINVQQFMPYLATMAGVMGQDLPTAATAFLDAFETDRFFMMQRRLRVTKEELEAFGLEVDKNGKIIKETLVPAFEALVASKFPGGLSEIMGTLSGQLANMTDQLQQLGMAFGKPVFEEFKVVMFGIIGYLNANHDAIWGFASAVGAALGGALAGVIPLLGQLVQFLQNNHAALAAIGAVLMGLVIGALVVLASLLSGVIGIFSGFFGIAVVVGTALSGLAMVFIHLYQTSGPFRDTVNQLWQAISSLAQAITGALMGALKDLLSPLQGVAGHVHDLFGYFQNVDAPMSAFGRAAHAVGDGARNAAGGVDALSGRVEVIRGPLSGVLDVVHRFADHIRDIASAVKSGDFSGFTGAVEKIVTVFFAATPIAAALGGAIAFFATHAGAASKVVDSVVTVVRNLGPAFQIAFNGFVNFIDRIPSFLTMFDGVFTAVFHFFDTLPSWSFLGELLMNVLQNIAGAFWGLLAPLLPIIAVVAAVAAVVASVVVAFLYWWQTSEGFRNAIAGMLGLVASLGSVLMTSLKPAWEQIQSSIAQLKPVWDQLVAAFHQLQPLLIFIGTIIIAVLVVAFGLLFGVLKGVLSAIGPVIAGLIQMFTGVVQIVAGVITFIVTLVSGIFNIIKDIFTGDGASLAKDWDNLWHGLLNSLGTILTGIWNLISGFFGGLWGGISGLIGGFVSGVIDWFKNLADTLVGHSIIPDMILAIIKWIASLPGAVIGFITGMITTVITAILGWRDQAIQFVMDMVTGILQAAISLELEIIVTINRMVNMAIAAILHWRDEGIALVGILVSGFISLVLSLYSQATGLISSMVNAVVSFISGMVSRVVSFVVNMVNSFAGVFRGLIGTASGIASNIVSAIGGVIGGLAGSMARWASDAVAGFIGIFSGLVDKARQIASDAAAAIAGFLHHSKPDEGPMADDDKWMPDFVDMMAQGISGNKDKLAKAAADATATMKQQIGDSLNDTSLSTKVANQIGQGANASTQHAALVKENGKGGGDTHVTVNMTMPDSFAAGFAMLDGESRRNLANQLKDSISDQLARDTDRQTLASTGYAGNSRS